MVHHVRFRLQIEHRLLDPSPLLESSTHQCHSENICDWSETTHNFAVLPQGKLLFGSNASVILSLPERAKRLQESLRLGPCRLCSVLLWSSISSSFPFVHSCHTIGQGY